MKNTMQLVHETDIEKNRPVILHFLVVEQTYDDNGVHKSLDSFTREYADMTTGATVVKAWRDFTNKIKDSVEMTSETFEDDFRGQVRFVEGCDNGMFWTDTLISVSYKNQTSMMHTELLPITKNEFLAYVDADLYDKVYKSLEKKTPSIVYRNPLV